MSTNALEEKRRDKVRNLSKSNASCCICTTNLPNNVVMQFGTFVCQLCASAHRQLNHQGVRTISSANFSREEVDFLASRGNEKVRELLGIAREPKKVRSNYSTDKAFVNDVKDFIHQAFDKKAFAKKKDALESSTKEESAPQARSRRISFSGGEKGAKLVPNASAAVGARRRTTSNASVHSSASAGSTNLQTQEPKPAQETNFLDDVFTSHEPQQANGGSNHHQAPPQKDARSDLLSHLDDMFAPMEPQVQQGYYQAPQQTTNYYAPTNFASYGQPQNVYQQPQGAYGGYGQAQYGAYGQQNAYTQPSAAYNTTSAYTGGYGQQTTNMYQQPSTSFQQPSHNAYTRPVSSQPAYGTTTTTRSNTSTGGASSNPFGDDADPFAVGTSSHSGASNPFGAPQQSQQHKPSYQQPQRTQNDQFSNLVGSFGKMGLSSSTDGTSQQKSQAQNARPQQPSQSSTSSNPFSSPARPAQSQQQHTTSQRQPSNQPSSFSGRDPFGLSDDFSPVSQAQHHHTSSSQQIRQEAISHVDADAFQFENTWKNQNVSSSDRVREGNTGFSLKPEKSFQQNVGWRNQQ